MEISCITKKLDCNFIFTGYRHFGGLMLNKTSDFAHFVWTAHILSNVIRQQP